MSDRSEASAHRKSKENEVEEADPVIAKLQKTGCINKHFAVLVRILRCFEYSSVGKSSYGS